MYKFRDVWVKYCRNIEVSLRYDLYLIGIASYVFCDMGKKIALDGTTQNAASHNRNSIEK